jgi:hypothetical protein
MAKHPTHILELAKRGAEARLQDLVHEARILVDLFPHLKDSFDKDELPVDFIVARGSGRLKKDSDLRRGKPMTAAQKKAVSERMKKYWARRKRETK